MEALREALQNERDAHAAQQREWQVTPNLTRTLTLRLTLSPAARVAGAAERAEGEGQEALPGARALAAILAHAHARALGHARARARGDPPRGGGPGGQLHRRQVRELAARSTSPRRRAAAVDRVHPHERSRRGPRGGQLIGTKGYYPLSEPTPIVDRSRLAAESQILVLETNRTIELYRSFSFREIIFFGET